MMPAGVHARGPGSAATRLPTLHGWNPSTSFSGEIVSRILLALICGGSGSCTRMPSISGSSFSPPTTASNSSVVIVAAQYDGESRRAALRRHGVNAGLQFSFDFVANPVAIEDTGHLT